MAATQAGPMSGNKTMSGVDGRRHLVRQVDRRQWKAQHRQAHHSSDSAGDPHRPINERTQVSPDAKGPLSRSCSARPLTMTAARCWSASRVLRRADRSLTSTRSSKSSNDRRKWWDLLAKFRDGTLGIIGLMLYLGVIAAFIGGICGFWPEIMAL